MTAPRRIFVTTALPYANGSFHIGHIMEYIQADIWVRFQRMIGNEVHFVGADDAHGAPIMLKAEAEGISIEQIIDQALTMTDTQGGKELVSTADSKEPAFVDTQSPIKAFKGYPR